MLEPTDHELAEVEAALRQLRPAPLSPDFQRQLAMQMPAGGARGGTRTRLAAVLGAMLAAVTVVVAAVVTLVIHSRRSASLQLEPISSQNLLLSATDEGAVTLGDGTPARQIRASYLQTTQWKDTASKATIVWTVPSEEVQIVPVSYE